MSATGSVTGATLPVTSVPVLNLVRPSTVTVAVGTLGVPSGFLLIVTAGDAVCGYYGGLAAVGP